MPVNQITQLSSPHLPCLIYSFTLFIWNIFANKIWKQVLQFFYCRQSSIKHRYSSILHIPQESSHIDFIIDKPKTYSSYNSKTLLFIVKVVILRCIHTVVFYTQQAVNAVVSRWCSIHISCCAEKKNLMGTKHVLLLQKSREIANNLWTLYWILSGCNWLRYIKLEHNFGFILI